MGPGWLMSLAYLDPVRPEEGAVLCGLHCTCHDMPMLPTLRTRARHTYQGNLESDLQQGATTGPTQVAAALLCPSA